MAPGALNTVGQMAGLTAASIRSNNAKQRVGATAAFATKIRSIRAKARPHQREPPPQKTGRTQIPPTSPFDLYQGTFYGPAEIYLARVTHMIMRKS
jgi:hypothetical protein